MTKEQITQEAERYAKQNCRSCNGAFVPCICHNLRKAVARGAEFVLSSLQSRIKELEQENERLKLRIEDMKDWDREMNERY